MTVKEISEKTSVQLGVVIIFVSALLVLTSRITTLEANQSNHDVLDNKRVEKLEIEMNEYRKDITEIKVNVANLLGREGKIYKKSE